MKISCDIGGTKYFEEVTVVDGKHFFPKITYKKSRRKIVIRIVVSENILKYDVKYGILGGFLLLRTLLSNQVVGNTVKAKSVEYTALKSFVTLALKRLISEVGPEFATKIYFTPTFLFYDLLASYRSLVGYLDPINVCSLMNIEKVRSTFLAKFLSYLKYLKKQEILCPAGNSGYLKICESFLKKARKTPLLLTERIIREIIVPYMEYSLKVRNIMPLAIIIPEIRESLPKIVAPSPYSELYIEIDDKIMPFHKGFENISYVKSLGSAINYTFLGEAELHGRKMLVVVKKYRDWKSLKWLPIGLWTIGTVDFALSASERLLREVNAITLLRKSGLRVPMVLGINWHRKYVVREYVEGSNLVEALHNKDFENACYRLGGLLADIHKLGLSIGDTRPTNFILDKHRTIVPIDLEQASQKIPPSWDIAEYIAFATVYLKFKFDESFIAAKSLAKGYLENEGSFHNVCNTVNRGYIRVLAPISPLYPFIVKKLNRELGCS